MPAAGRLQRRQRPRGDRRCGRGGGRRRRGRSTGSVGVAAYPGAWSGSTPASPSRSSSTTPTSPTRSRPPSRPCDPLTEGRVIVVLGAGGDRDPGKRPLMGEIAARLADLLVVTDDNPQERGPGRDPRGRAGRVGGPGRVVEVGDRRTAIRVALAEAVARRRRADRRQGSRDRPGGRRRGAPVRRPRRRARGAPGAGPVIAADAGRDRRRHRRRGARRPRRGGRRTGHPRQPGGRVPAASSWPSRGSTWTVTRTPTPRVAAGAAAVLGDAADRRHRPSSSPMPSRRSARWPGTCSTGCPA